MTGPDEDVWSSRRSESQEEALRAGAELSGMFDAVDSWYVDGNIRLPRVTGFPNRALNNCAPPA